MGQGQGRPGGVMGNPGFNPNGPGNPSFRPPMGGAMQGVGAQANNQPFMPGAGAMNMNSGDSSGGGGYAGANMGGVYSGMDGPTHANYGGANLGGNYGGMGDMGGAMNNIGATANGGPPPGTMYAGGNPNFNEDTGKQYEFTGDPNTPRPAYSADPNMGGAQGGGLLDPRLNIGGGNSMLGADAAKAGYSTVAAGPGGFRGFNPNGGGRAIAGAERSWDRYDARQGQLGENGMPKNTGFMPPNISPQQALANQNQGVQSNTSGPQHAPGFDPTNPWGAGGAVNGGLAPQPTTPAAPGHYWSFQNGQFVQQPLSNMSSGANAVPYGQNR